MSYGVYISDSLAISGDTINLGTVRHSPQTPDDVRLHVTTLKFQQAFSISDYVWGTEYGGW